ncbi:hypothetical protein [Aliivibrio logei]|nr:hypothetical protein [Aliivibrio logei]
MSAQYFDEKSSYEEIELEWLDAMEIGLYFDDSMHSESDTEITLNN